MLFFTVEIRTSTYFINIPFVHTHIIKSRVKNKNEIPIYIKLNKLKMERLVAI